MLYYEKQLSDCTINECQKEVNIPLSNFTISEIQSKELSIYGIFLGAGNYELAPFIMPNIVVVDYEQKEYLKKLFQYNIEEGTYIYTPLRTSTATTTAESTNTNTSSASEKIEVETPKEIVVGKEQEVKEVVTTKESTEKTANPKKWYENHWVILSGCATTIALALTLENYLKK